MSKFVTVFNYAVDYIWQYYYCHYYHIITIKIEAKNKLYRWHPCICWFFFRICSMLRFHFTSSLVISTRTSVNLSAGTPLSVWFPLHLLSSDLCYHFWVYHLPLFWYDYTISITFVLFLPLSCSLLTVCLIIPDFPSWIFQSLFPNNPFCW